MLSVLLPINTVDQPLPKYRYASAGSLYSIQVYVEVNRSVNNIRSGLYYHNPDKHSLDLVREWNHDNSDKIRLHLVGRASAIDPLYGRKLGLQLRELETGYIMGLLKQTALELGWTLMQNYC